jgi:hypothetical protein
LEFGSKKSSQVRTQLELDTNNPSKPSSNLIELKLEPKEKTTNQKRKRMKKPQIGREERMKT